MAPFTQEQISAQASWAWAAAYGLVPDPSWTEDLVKEMFLRASDLGEDLRDPGSFRDWFLPVARKLAWQATEAAAHRASAPDEPLPADLIEPLDPEAARERAHRVLSGLPGLLRVPMTLLILNVMDYGSVRDALGMDEEIFHPLVVEGMERLRRGLDSEWRPGHGHS